MKFIALLSALFLATGCGNSAGFGGGSGKKGGTAINTADTAVTDGDDAANQANASGNPNDTDETNSGKSVTPATVEAVCAAGTKQQLKKSLVYAARKDCNWGVNGNLTIEQGFIRAREFQTEKVPMPAGAIICGINLVSKTAQIHFDDFFSFDVNSIVLAASTVIANALEADKEGFRMWNWERVLNKPLQDIGKYCGAGSCQLPEHDRPGKFDVSISLEKAREGIFQPAALAGSALFAKLSGATELAFTATATGDNDEEDCAHSGGEFDLTIDYVSQ